MRSRARFSLVAAFFLLPMGAYGQCPDKEAVAAYLADFEAARPSKGLGNTLSLADAECARGKVVAELPRLLGPRIGYKAAFTNPAVQKRYGLAGPSWGVMFARGMVQDGARVPARFGARPSFEPDLVVVVKDARLASANSPLEALQHLDAIRPFIELPDLMLEGEPPGAAYVATNVSFRGGVLGAPVQVQATEAFAAALATMTVITVDAQGNELGRATGDLLMGHPMNAAIWLARALEKNGITLEPGDLLSLGAFLPPSPVEAKTGLTVRYVGLPGDPSVRVRFEP